MQVGCKNISILIDGPVLDDSLSALAYFNDLPESAVQEIYLQVKMKNEGSGALISERNLVRRCLG